MLVETEKKLSGKIIERIPKRITPDSLLDTFVQIHYKLKINKEVLFTTANKILVPEYSLLELDAEARKASGFRDDEAIFSGNGVLFRIREKLVSFTCSEGYIGWEQYRIIIQSVVQKMWASQCIEEFPRVSVRYINSLPWAPLNKQVGIALPVLPHLPKSEHILYQTTGHNEEGFQIDIILTDNARIGDSKEAASLFDIGVAHTTPFPMQNLETVLSELDKAHTIEKEIFFSILDSDFLSKLNPEY